MYLIYTLTLGILLLILIMLWQEEKRLRASIIHGIASKYWILREKRKFIRFNEEIKIRYNLLHEPSKLNYTKTANISRNGLCLVTYEKVKEKSSLDLEIEVPCFSKPAKARGQVVWIKELHSPDSQGRRLFYIGLRFSKINPESEAMLLTHLNSLKQK